MRRLLAFFTAFLLFCCCVGGYWSYLHQLGSPTNKTDEHSIKAVNDYWLNRKKFQSPDFIKQNMEPNTMLVFGSSELSTKTIDTHPQNLFLKQGYNFNTMLVGQGYYQSLWHTIALGALDDGIQTRKVTIIVSAQWFSKDGVTPKVFSGTYSKAMSYQFMKNPAISNELKEKVAKRVKQLDSTTPSADVLLAMGENKVNLFKNMEITTDNFLNGMKIANDIKSVNLNYTEYLQNKDVNSIDWNQLLTKAEQDGAKACTNNEFGVNNTYYKTYVEKELSNRKGSQKDLSYAVSPEYDDFQLFLDVCKDTKIQPLVIIVPVNGFWSDYTQFPKTERQAYYQKIRNICKQNNVNYADFSDKEYEKYFLSDVMHLGWKGWVDIDEAIVKFAR